MSLRKTARRLGLGKLLYQTVYRPRQAADRLKRDGLQTVVSARRGREEMIAAAKKIRPLPKDHNDPKVPTEVTFLTGKDYWHMTLFCAASLVHFSGRNIGVAIVDDGTLTPDLVHEFKRVLPRVRMRMYEDVFARVNRELPKNKFPTLRERRENYPHIRKLTDVHAGMNGWQIVLDSDMLFFRRPDALMEWLYEPNRPVHMYDCEESYGYSRELMTDLTGNPVPSMVNVGIVGLRSEDIDWERLELQATRMIEREGYSYLQEQALTAMLISGTERLGLSPEEYICKPEAEEIRNPTAVLHHYVNESRNDYYRIAWRRFLEEYNAE